MILENKDTTVAFRCPCCGKAILSSVNIFRLRGDLIRLRCPDCDIALSMRRSSDGKIRLTVPCFLCEHPHNITISENAFFGNDLFSVPCSLSGIDIFFAGEREKVEEAMKKSGEELDQLLKDAQMDNFSAFKKKNEEETDPAVDSVVHLLLTELEEEGKITCYCKEEGEIPLYDFQVLQERVRIFCHCCNAEAYLPLSSEADAVDFIKTDRIDLK